MGSTVRIKGEIRIDPPIPWGECKDSDFVIADDDYSSPLDLKLRIVEQAVDTAEGMLIRRHADAVVEAGDERRGVYVIEELRQIIDQFGAGRTLSGRLDLTCRDYMEQWRVKVVDGIAMKFVPEIVWPEASE